MSNPPVLGAVTPLIPSGADVERVIAFYEQQLGFETVHREGDPATMAIVKRGSAEIMLQQNVDRHVAEQTALRIQVDGVEGLYAEYQAKGGSMIHPIGKLEAKPWGSKEFAVLDPAGVCIAFYEFPE